MESNKNLGKKYWLRGGFVFLGIYLLLFGIFLFLESKAPLSDISSIIQPSSAYDLIRFILFVPGGRLIETIFGSLGTSYQVLWLIIMIGTTPVFLFGLGSVIGLIYGKIKNKNGK